jgi:hypothetical protein
MQAAILPMSAGWYWIQQGFTLFKRQPLAMFFWSLVTSFLITVGYMVPLLGQMILIIITPMLTFIILNACRRVAQGQTMLLPMWLEPLRSRDVRKRLLALGLAYMVCCLGAGLLATLPFLGSLSGSVTANGTLDEQALFHAMQWPLLTFGLLYVLVSALFWHAPALIGWHGIRMSQALFFSMVACWRNKWPFLLYGAVWAGIFAAVQWLGVMASSLGVSASAVQVLLTPLNIIIAAVLYCSFYPAYVSVFGSGYRAAN